MKIQPSANLTQTRNLLVATVREPNFARAKPNGPHGQPARLPPNAEPAARVALAGIIAELSARSLSQSLAKTSAYHDRPCSSMRYSQVPKNSVDRETHGQCVRGEQQWGGAASLQILRNRYPPRSALTPQRCKNADGSTKAFSFLDACRREPEL